ncbi:MAG: Flp pilus assembly complex ATPase component TadA [Candidatus Omnitrophica bacterium]|nr:Flp pilus assembly complex ATPase component TadA [Candidatus Omnitrophota bacterium]
MDNSKLRKRIGEILMEQGYITSAQLEEALEEQKITGEKLGEIMIRKGWISQEVLNQALANQTGVSTFDLSTYIIDPEVIKLIPEEVATKYKVVPVFKIDNTLTVAMVDPNNVFVIDELSRITGCIIEPVLADEIAIRKAHDQYYGGAGTIQEIISRIDKEKLAEGEKLGEEAPIVKLVNMLIVEAVQSNASDIHIEPEEKFVGVRYRVDGILRRRTFLPKDLQPAVISRLKIMSGLDIAEKRIPQDGRIIMKVANKDIDFRVSTCPTVHGENIVLRILDKSSVNIGLEKLGFPSRELELFKELIFQPYGIILVTGPTGSGKTTTLYSALQKINREEVNIMTVEDPVEYQFPRIRQVQVNVKAGLTFASALRSFLRQDPDVIMVGEIRDLETAEIAVQAALTGHLVLSTLHTNDSPSAFTRLIDMGVEPFLVSSSILGVLAQRLIRKVCSKCKEEYTPSSALIKDLGLEGKVSESIKFVKGRGCKLCNSSGYKGRIGIFELLKVTPKIQELVLSRASADDIGKVAHQEGMRSLREAAIDKLLEGVTTPEEVMRVTQSLKK